MPDAIIDASILIDAVNHHPKAVRYLEQLIDKGANVTHIQAVAELIAGTRDAAEQRRLFRYLRSFQIQHISVEDSESALQFFAKFHLSHNLGFGDCLIGATALRLNLPVATLNIRDFRLFKGLTVIRPY